jgi:hypothetical protein
MTPVTFKLSNPINSKQVKKGARISFETAHDVTIKSPQGDTLIPRGTIATGAVEKAKKAWWFFGKQGHLQISMPTQIQDLKGNIFSLVSSQSRMESKGGGDRRYWSPILGIFVFPLFLIWRGKNAKLLEGFQAHIHNPVQGGVKPVEEPPPAYKEFESKAEQSQGKVVLPPSYQVMDPPYRL